MDRQRQTGIPVEGGVITFEPGTSKARFWIRETIPRLIWGLTLGDDPYSPGEPRSPVYIVIWNSERTVEYHREGPYKGNTRTEKLDQLRDEIAREGLTEALFKRRLGTGPPQEPTVG